ncbi:MAG: HAMP domain-containing protein, partial [Planctomycetota bacterium]
MLRGFRHTLFLLLQLGALASGAVAIAIWPHAWRAVLVCLIGVLIVSLVCERLARRYLRRALGNLRRTVEQVSAGNLAATIEVHPGDDFYKLINAVNHVVERVADASREERRLHEQLRRRERLAFLGELAASVAHEINNPLDGTQNCLRILRRSQADPQRVAHMLDLIEAGLGRIELIVRRLLTLAREHVIRPSVACLHEVVDAALSNCRNHLDERGIRVTRDFETQHDAASVDTLLLEQVFANIIMNAADAMPDGGELRITITGVCT